MVITLQVSSIVVVLASCLVCTSSEMCCSGVYPSPFFRGATACPQAQPGFPSTWMTYNSLVTCSAGTICQVMSCVGTYFVLGATNGTNIPYYAGGCASSMTAMLTTANSAKNVKWWEAHAMLFYATCAASNYTAPPPSLSTTGSSVPVVSFCMLHSDCHGT